MHILSFTTTPRYKTLSLPQVYVRAPQSSPFNFFEKIIKDFTIMEKFLSTYK
jgi:hypothetical protein